MKHRPVNELGNTELTEAEQLQQALNTWGRIMSKKRYQKSLPLRILVT